MNTVENTSTIRSSSETAMTAYTVHEFGPPDVIRAEVMAIPHPQADEVLVRVHAAGVGPWDGWIRSGKSALPQPLPLTLGSDLSGVVEAVGPGVTHLKVGDEVYGVTNPRFIGAYAEHAIAAAGMVARKPVSISHVEAASVPVIAVTALQALFQHGKLKAGDTVLIHGAAGSVGAYAIQFARRARLNVIATAATEDLGRVREMGADKVVDYKTGRFEDVAKDVDVVVDLVGGDTQARSFSVLKRGGKLVSAVSQPDQELANAAGVEAFFFLVAVSTSELLDIAAAIDTGELRQNVGLVLPLSQAVQAHRILEGELPRPKGKVVLKVRD